MNNIWQGNKVRLRAVRVDDWQDFFVFGQDTEVSQSAYEIPFPSSEDSVKEWTRKTALTEPTGDVFRWVIENDESQFVGTLNTFDCVRRFGTFKYGIAVKREFWKRGYASEAIRLVLVYYFHELRYQKVTSHVYDFNEASLKLHERLGFQREGRLRRMGFTNGKFFDEIMLGMTVEEFDAKWGSR